MLNVLKHSKTLLYTRQFHSRAAPLSNNLGFFSKIFGGKKTAQESDSSNLDEQKETTNSQAAQKAAENNSDNVTSPTQTPPVAKTQINQSFLNSDNVILSAKNDDFVIESDGKKTQVSNPFVSKNHNYTTAKGLHFNIDEVEQKLEPIIQEICPTAGESWKTYDISSVSIKQKVALSAFKVFGKEINGLALNSINNVSDLIQFYARKPNPLLVKHAVAKYFTSLDNKDIPQNLRFIKHKKKSQKSSRYR
ncbi:hypothetical protein BB561_006838 [Smittium simulii]|uniref:Uncharacterized protein n=1 Tax=Smittium simulii TaxID=133385 RepID=A0A2T9Y106_9FUNG|nr:hypothetical protein BB561_006838 [Smittium simulii]